MPTHAHPSLQVCCLQPPYSQMPRMAMSFLCWLLWAPVRLLTWAFTTSPDFGTAALSTLARWVRVVLKLPEWGIWDNFPFTLWVPLLSEMNNLCLLGISSCWDCSLSLSLCQMPALQIIISWKDSRLRSSSCSTSDMDMLVIGFRLLASHGSIGRHHIDRSPWQRQMLLFSILLGEGWGEEGRAAAFEEYLVAEHLLQKQQRREMNCVGLWRAGKHLLFIVHGCENCCETPCRFTTKQLEPVQKQWLHMSTTLLAKDCHCLPLWDARERAERVVFLIVFF